MAFSWRNKKVLVTGGAGFLGSWVVKDLVNAGADVSVVVSVKANLRNLAGFEKNIKVYKGDLLDFGFVTRATRAREYIFHFAALKKNVFFHSEHPARVLRTNTLIAMNVLEAATARRVRRIIFISSTVAENIGENNPNFGYAWSKKIAEVFAETYRREYGLSAVSVRIPNCFGEYDNFYPETAQIVPSLIRRAVSGENPLVVYGNPNEVKHFCYAKDISALILKIGLATHGNSVVTIPPSYSVSIRDLAKNVVSQIDKSIKLNFVDSKKFVKGSVRAAAGPYLSIGKQRELQTSLKRTIDWYKLQKS